MRNGGSISVLLVDADRDYAEQIREGLSGERYGYVVNHVEALGAALEHLGVEAVDAVVMDPELPDSDTSDAVSMVRTKVPDIPLVVITSLENEQVLTKAMHHGAQDCLSKDQADLHGVARAVRHALERKYAGQALRESEERFRRVFDEGPVGMALVGRGARLVRANAALCQMLGRTREELADLSVREITHGGDSADITQVERVIEGEIPYFQTECRFLRRNGSLVWGMLTASVVRDQNDRLLYGIVMVEDITERRRAEEAVRESHSLLHAVIGGTPDAIYVKDLTGRYLLLNSAAAELLGRSAADIVGKTDYELLPESVASSIRQSDIEVAESGRACTFEESFVVDGDARTYLSTKGVYRDEADNIVGLFGIARDITERTKAEAELRRSEAKYRALVDHAVYGIYSSSLAGRFLSVNRALVSMLGYESEEELLGIRMDSDLYADPSEREQLVAQYLHRDRIEGLEVEWKRRDQTRILVRLSGRLVHGDDGQPEGFEMIVEDVTERRNLETQLRQAQKMEAVGELTGGIAHDLNNVLTIISANLDLIGESLPKGNADLSDDLLQSKEAAQRGRALIRKLLGFSRRSKLEMKPVDVGQLVADLLGMLRRVVPANIEVSLSVVDCDPIDADSGAIEQMLINLVTNARDAMPEGGAIAITVGPWHMDKLFRAARPWAKLDHCLRLRVEDSGLGMDPQTVERVFEPFFTTKPHGTGTGLGMAMVYGLVKQHGGFVDVSSKAGSGSTIDLYFPFSKGSVAAPIKEQPARPVRGGSECILLVEDEAPIRRVARRVLEKHGYDVVVAVNGNDALARFEERSRKIDLVISDVVMPKLGGAGLYKKLSAGGDPPKILFTSGYTAKDFRTSGAIDPSLPFLHKPWSVNELLDKVREVLDS
jgi:PAS domain S-box-containing protein